MSNDMCLYNPAIFSFPPYYSYIFTSVFARISTSHQLGKHKQVSQSFSLCLYNLSYVLRHAAYVNSEALLDESKQFSAS